MGVEPYLLASSLEGVLAQRLVRTICPSCKEPHRPEPQILQRIGNLPGNGNAGEFYLGKGCRHCRQTGYSGRVGIFELLRITPTVRQAITRRATAGEIAAVAPADHQPMRQDGYHKACEGVTTLEEVLRVTQDTQTEEALTDAATPQAQDAADDDKPMSDFTYSALDEAGQAVSGEIEAPERGQAIATLAQRKVFVTVITERQAQASHAAGHPVVGLFHRRRVPPRARAAMLGQLATALKAGLPLLSGLRVVEQQTEGSALRNLVADLAQRVQAGESMSDAMAAHPDTFKRLEVSMVRVGEAAGLLDQVMGYLAEFAERNVNVRQKIRSAATYPAFVLGLAVVSVIIIITVILPRVIGVVTENVGSATLPAPTRVLLWLSDSLKAYGWLLVIAIVAGVAAFRRWLTRPGVRLAFDAFKLKVPVLGTAIRRVAVGRFARTLGTLSKSGIQIIEALTVLRDTLGNEALARRIDEVTAGIAQGQSIAEPLRKTGEFPPLLIQVIAMGERTGRLDELLLQTAQAYEKETDAAVQRVMTVLPAVLIVLLALVVAFVLTSVLLPVLEMRGRAFLTRWQEWRFPAYKLGFSGAYGSHRQVSAVKYAGGRRDQPKFICDRKRIIVATVEVRPPLVMRRDYNYVPFSPVWLGGQRVRRRMSVLSVEIWRRFIGIADRPYRIRSLSETACLRRRGTSPHKGNAPSPPERGQTYALYFVLFLLSCLVSDSIISSASGRSASRR